MAKEVATDSSIGMVVQSMMSSDQRQTLGVPLMLIV